MLSNGYVQDNTDCDDDDPLNYPTNVEVCDGRDNNCNAVADESSAQDAKEWFLDGDQDGYPAFMAALRLCEPPDESYILLREDGAVDCDDTNEDIHPDSVEVCNGVDDDCNLLVDDSAQIGLNDCYLDLDGDGFGDELNYEQACSCAVGYVTNVAGCNDTNAAVFPSAMEYCNGGDDDCNGVIDDQAVDPTVYYLDADGDMVGGATTLVACPVLNNQGDWVPPPNHVEITGDCNDNDASISPLHPESCSPNIDENCDGDNTLGAIDPDLYWVDTDRDLVGDPIYALTSCTTPIGYVLVEDLTTELVDCDDRTRQPILELLSCAMVSWIIVTMTMAI